MLARARRWRMERCGPAFRLPREDPPTHDERAQHQHTSLALLHMLDELGGSTCLIAQRASNHKKSTRVVRISSLGKGSVPHLPAASHRRPLSSERAWHLMLAQNVRPLGTEELLIIEREIESAVPTIQKTGRAAG
jgi:hypothetical protein